MTNDHSVQALVESFAVRVQAHAESAVESRVRQVLASLLTPGRPIPGPKRSRLLSAEAARAPLSAKAARGRRLQGQYLGALRSLRGAARERVKRTARAEGVAAAVKLAASLRT